MDLTTSVSTLDSAKSDLLVESACTYEYIPSCLEFLEVLGPAGWALLALALPAMLTLIALYLDTLNYVMNNVQTRHKTHTAVVISVYPVLGLCSFLGLVFQKANIFLDTVVALWFALCMWQFLLLTLSYFGGESRLVAKMKGSVLPWKSPPCCCWPCCVCPKTPVNRRQIRMVRMLVTQHPWVQVIVSIFQLTLWVEGWYHHACYSFTDGYLYIYLISTLSFTFGLWAFIVGFKASLTQLQEFHYTPKIVSFQLCVVFFRLQAIIVNSILVPAGAIPSFPKISSKVFANTLLNSLLLGQLVILSIVARHFYKLPVPDVVSLDDDLTKEKPQINNNNVASSDLFLPQQDQKHKEPITSLAQAEGEILLSPEDLSKNPKRNSKEDCIA